MNLHDIVSSCARFYCRDWVEISVISKNFKLGGYVKCLGGCKHTGSANLQLKNILKHEKLH